VKKYSNFFLLILILGISCADKNVNGHKTAQLIPLSIKSIPLDNETNFAFLKPKIYTIQNAEYLSFYNENTRTIYVHQYKDNIVLNKIPLAKEGPDEIKGSYIKGYHIHTLDSIFVDAREFVYLVNSSGKVLDKIELPQQEDGRRFYSGLETDLSTSTYFRNNTLYTNIEIQVPNKESANPIRGALNFNTHAIEKTIIEKREVFKDYDAMVDFDTDLEKHGGYIGISAQTITNADTFYITSKINDSIYEYVGENLKNRFFAGHTNFPAHTYQDHYNSWDIKTGNGISMISKPKSGPYFTDFVPDPEFKNLFRLLIHGKKEVIEETTQKKDTEDDSNPLNVFANLPKSQMTGASLIVFNLKEKSSSIYPIPIDEVIPTNFFISKSGIHFRIKNQESENELRYKIFNISP